MELTFSQKDCLDWAIAETIGKPDLSKTLRVKLGIDPTSPDIHLGRSIVVWRLRAFQELGHEIHLIIGDFTGQIGDTSDKEAERPMLSAEVVQENLKRYEEQLWLILNPAKKEQVHFHYNSEWLAKMTLAEVSQLADHFSVNTFIKRELVAKRLESGSRVSLREMLYPLMQGYDSLAVSADIELGGTDQRFNLLAGRTLQEAKGLAPQSIIMNPLIRGLDGRKMSSSWGNVIKLLDTPTDKFGKMMALADELMAEYLFVLPSSAQPFSTEQLANRLAAGENPRDLKLELAEALVALYHGEAEAKTQRGQWIAQFSEQKLPTDIPEKNLIPDLNIVELLVALELAESKSEARRLIEQKGVRLDGETVSDPNMQPKTGLLEVGKRRLLRLV